jgi:FkbM family methyltransferase
MTVTNGAFLEAGRRDCPYAYGFPGRRSLSPWKDRALHAAIPLVRGYTRYARSPHRRQKAWDRWVEPYLAWHPHTFRARTVFGATLAGDTREVLQQHVYYFGMWEPNLTRWLSGRLRPGDTFIDVGANIGYFTLLGSRLVGPRGRVVAIEALPSTFACLTDNLKRNRSSNARPINAVASDRAGCTKVFRGPDSHTGLATVLHAAGHELEGEVPAAPVTSLLTADELTGARVIKIDVEGFEFAVLRGLLPGLGQARSDLELVVEVHPAWLRGQGHSAADMAHVLAAEGFNCYGLHVDYTAAGMINGGSASGAWRLTDVPELEMDIVFSREDRDVL